MIRVDTLDSAPQDADGQAAGKRYGRLLTQGSAYAIALQLCSVSAVLPILCARWGSMWAAGLIYPVFSVGIIAGYAASPIVLGRARHLKHLVLAGGCALMGALFVCVTFALENTLFVDTAFLIVSAGLGTARGICDGTRRELISAMLPLRRQSPMVLAECAVSAVIIVVVTLLVIPALSDQSAGGDDLTDLFLGAGAMFAAAAAGLFIGPVRAHTTATPPRLGDSMRRTALIAKSQNAFRKYAIAQLLFVPITLGATFYALHIPAADPGSRSSLPTLVLSSAAGLLIGAFLWRAVHRATGIQGMLIGGTVTASSAAVICTFAHGLGLWSQTWVHGLIFLLTAAANQAINAATTEWIGMFAEEADRPALVGFTAAATALVKLVVGFGLNAIAANTSATWPALIMLLLDAVAVAAALRADATPDRSPSLPLTSDPIRLPDRWLRGEDPVACRISRLGLSEAALAS